MQPLLALLRKELILEWRQQYTLYGMLLYVASTVFVIYLAMGQPESVVWNGLFWVIQLFVCVNAVAKSFLQEGRGRLLYYYSIVGPTVFVLAKLIFNTLLMTFMSIVSYCLFQLLLGNPVLHLMRFFGIVWLGGVSLSLVFTFLAAIAAKAQQNAALMAILGFPLLAPQIMLLMKISNTAFGSVVQMGADQIYLYLIGMDIMVIILALILYPYLWKD